MSNLIRRSAIGGIPDQSTNRHSTMTQSKTGFTLISKDAYIDRFLKANPSERRDNVVARLDNAIAAHKEGTRCSCGEQIWIVVSPMDSYSPAAHA
jgi:hypothetical protein